MPPACRRTIRRCARAVDWLVAVQRDDGGWGEDEESYGDAPHGRYKESTPSQTAWAVLGLMAAGAVDHPAVARGVAYLAATQRDGRRVARSCRTTRSVSRACSICATTAIGWYFPLLALARYRNLRRGNTQRVAVGF